MRARVKPLILVCNIFRLGLLIYYRKNTIPRSKDLSSCITGAWLLKKAQASAGETSIEWLILRVARCSEAKNSWLRRGYCPKNLLLESKHTVQAIVEAKQRGAWPPQTIVNSVTKGKVLRVEAGVYERWGVSLLHVTVVCVVFWMTLTQPWVYACRRFRET